MDTLARKIRRTKKIAALSATVAIVATVALAAPVPHSKSQSQSAPRVKLQPRFVPGEVREYRIEIQIDTDMKNGGAVQDPQGPSQRTIAWDATIRLDVLPASGEGGPTAQGAALPATPGIRVRTTYEESSATVRSDTPDPQSENIENTYGRLQGTSFEFILGQDGRVSSVHGLESLIADDKDRVAAEQWMSQLSGSGVFPAAGIAPGQRWSSEQSADSVPLTGLVWRTESTYLRNEPCRPAAPADATATIGGDTCAVILSQLSLDPKHATKDATPQEYRRNGLRTTGRWFGSGRSLNYVSLSSGWLVSSTQDATQDMDIAVLRSGEDQLHYAGKVHTHSAVSLSVPDAAPAGNVQSPIPKH